MEPPSRRLDPDLRRPCRDRPPTATAAAAHSAAAVPVSQDCSEPTAETKVLLVDDGGDRGWASAAPRRCSIRPDASAAAPIRRALAADEHQASAGAQSAPPSSCCHPWQAAVTLPLSRSMRLDTPRRPASSPESLLLSTSFRASAPTPARRPDWTTSRRVDRPRADARFARAKQKSRWRQLARARVVQSERVSVDERDACFPAGTGASDS